MNRTLVISIDALITADIQRLKELPHLGKIMKKASWVEDIFCIYPTLTYPCHATITTGCWPDRHGIINNEKFQPLAEVTKNFSRWLKTEQTGSGFGMRSRFRQ